MACRTTLPRTVALGFGIALTSALPVLTTVTAAHAQAPDDLAKARTLFREALSLEAAGNWSQALRKFEDVAKVKLTPQVRYHFGRCKENLGRLNEALGDYKIAEFEAAEAGAKELAEISKAREALEARVPKVVISRGPGTESASIVLDGTELGDAKVGNEVSVDPGQHAIVVKYSDGRSFQVDVNVAEGKVESVELVPPDDFPSAPRTRPDEPDEPSTDAPQAPEQAAPDEGPGPVPWLIGGVGLASLAASGVFFVLRSGAESDLESICRGKICPESSREKQDSGELYSTLTTVTLGVGVVGVGVAAVMLLSGGSNDSPPGAEGAKQNVTVRVGATPGFKGVEIAGRF